MADYYTVSANNSAGVEITGGRVGHFSITCSDAYFLGESGVSSGSGVAFSATPAHSFYVTSPDEVYLVLLNDASGTVKVFQNR